jgi:hypothetical protein
MCIKLTCNLEVMGEFILLHVLFPKLQKEILLNLEAERPC